MKRKEHEIQTEAHSFQTLENQSWRPALTNSVSECSHAPILYRSQALYFPHNKQPLRKSVMK